MQETLILCLTASVWIHAAWHRRGCGPPSLGLISLFHEAYCAKLLACQPQSYLTGVTGVPPPFHYALKN